MENTDTEVEITDSSKQTKDWRKSQKMVCKWKKK